MGEWSDYFDDFPEENPANWVNGRFDPAGARREHHRAEALTQAQADLNSTIRRMIDEGNRRASEKDAKP
ncbi:MULTISPECIES: hypothetical protein [Stenotrophomonas]|uniref:hypothetical protein n=1 Tax=Stenotrophomonas TaxID=40323 RepID=UPI00097643D3|nr:MULTISPECIES: hypothetical protein [Stenotrophomonas]OMO41572.1 hypothetical protein BU225_07670 [Stenotrophomonas sp. MB339]ASE52266.1 hypothetical protein CEQ03_05575 [Stenotrophomonas maltophilia]MBA0232212.1 hypothetical protein [Stenotrophomonas maltophilia]MBA0277554.1 hypothetical protein [Stenotrophomonas maltophilia]MBA0413027.1 hypothetical protein [Stenotrophomonas maltophilia]